MRSESQLIKSEAIVLSVRGFAHTSQMVTWITPRSGKVVTPIKGALRPKSPFLGQYDLYYTCQLIYYAREHEGVHQVREINPIAPREALRVQWRSAAAASYLSALVSRTLMSLQPAPEIFADLNATLDALCDPMIPPEPLLTWFELHHLQTLGLQPSLTPCPRCAGNALHTFNLQEATLCCAHTPAPHPLATTLMLHAETITCYNTLLITPLSELVAKLRTQPTLPGLLGLRRFLGLFLTQHLDLPPALRRTALELVSQ